MKTKNLLTLILLTGIISIRLTGQDSPTPLSREIYLSGNILNFTNLGLEYKSEIKEGIFFRMGFNSVDLDIYSFHNGDPNNTTNLTKRFEFSGRYEFGVEKRKTITDRLSAYYGVNQFNAGGFNRNKQEDPNLPFDLRFHDDVNITPGLSFNSGFILKIANSIYMAAEIAPEIAWSFHSSERTIGTAKVKDTYSNGLFSIGNQNIKVAFVYKWDKK